MKKIFGSIIIVLMLISISQISMAMEAEIEEENNVEDDLLNQKLFAAIGIVNVNKQSNVIRGYVFVGYNAGEIISFEMINIAFTGNPFVITKNIITTLCLYQPA